MAEALIKSDRASNQLSFKKCPEALWIRRLGYYSVPEMRGPAGTQMNLLCADAVFVILRDCL